MDEWWLVFVPDPKRWGPLPEEGVLGVRDLPTALEAVGLRPGDPVFVRPDFVVDAELLQFALSPDFRTGVVGAGGCGRYVGAGGAGSQDENGTCCCSGECGALHRPLTAARRPGQESRGSAK